MKKLLIIAAMAAIGAAAQADIIDQWDMDGNGQWQSSDNGVNLGGHYNTNNHALAQTADDGTFLFSQTGTVGFGGKTALSSSSDLTAGVVSLSLSYSALDFSGTPTSNAKLGFRLWNDAGDKFFGIDIADNSDKVFAQFSSNVGVGGNAGRLVNGLGSDDVDRTIVLELDYANSEVRMSGNWQWAADGVDAVFTKAYDFAGNGFTDISKFQTTYANWSAGDQITMDDITVEAVPEPATIGMLGLGALVTMFVRRMKNA